MRDFNRVIRYMAYTLELLVLFMLQEVPGLTPAVFGVRPVLIFPAVITVALFEEELPAMAFGVLGGLFCDFGLSGVMGVHAVLLAVLCYFLSLLSREWLRVNLITALLTGMISLALCFAAQWFFLYRFSYSMADYAFVHHYLPKFFYTLLFVPLTYLLNRGLFHAVREDDAGT